MTDSVPDDPRDTGPADEVLRELLPEFFTAWDRDLCNAIPAFVERGDVEATRRLGHTIKGSMMQFGFRGLAAVGVAIMQDAERGDLTSAYEHIKLLQQRLQYLRETLL